ncbi:hypothetical protein L3476_16535 [Paenibacillus thiaminolyticus]|uniref:hypothetical protein n=1 Tax=Paenibacillus thiaminolyticus TaxID=49283 RepID=UPI0011650B10|nr:hypothetical protein [Paenibacillus thiaminolyticus]NGP61480.1 hypothetical protein [Paenibacillus thiaminolyticus]WCR24984.1 hypothetical protein L3476_16535 [Paenibacillus thiaminolyticus]
MNNLKPDMIVSLLVFLDYFLTDEQHDKIWNLDINNQEDQLQVIRTVLVPGYYTFNEKEQRSMKKVLEMCMEDKKTNFDRVIMGLTMPFESDIVDWNAFFENIYKELFGEK